jgi:signal transduction histidine kinase/GGDEF domain-containing protein/ActR/RegA family two-component response regulator
MGGTISALDDAAVESMNQNAENRLISLENAMVFEWSNLDRLEEELKTDTDAFLSSEGLLLDEVLGDSQLEIRLLDEFSDSLITALRLNSVNGVYISLLGNTDRSNGLYYRDMSPHHSPTDNSDILFMRGSNTIARKDNIQLDSNWREDFPAMEEFAKPIQAAIDYPSLSTSDQSYWMGAHSLNPGSYTDANFSVTYTRPLIKDGRVIAVIGIDVQINRLEEFYPANDLGQNVRGGYMLLGLAGRGEGYTEYAVYSVTGAYVRRAVSRGGVIRLSDTDRSNVYRLQNGNQDALVILHPLRLYNSYSPFAGEEWMLAAIAEESFLYKSSEDVRNGVFVGSIVATFVGLAALSVFVRMLTKPLIQIANQLTVIGPNEPLKIENTKTYEIDLLCRTINRMKDKQWHTEAQLSEERERYLLALENAADTFIDYGIKRDNIIINYFSGESQQLNSRVIEKFLTKLYNFIHPDDTAALVEFITQKTGGTILLRINGDYIDYLNPPLLDGGYAWYLLKASYIEAVSEGKIVGTIKDVTAETLNQRALAESSRRDVTTGLYNRACGLEAIAERLHTSQNPMTCFFIQLTNFERLELRYGQTHAALILMELCNEFKALTTADDIFARVSNDSFLLVTAEATSPGAKKAAFEDRVGGFTAGHELPLTAAVGYAVHTGGGTAEELALNAYRNALNLTGPAERLPYKEASVDIDLGRQGIVGFTFELFERSLDVRGSIDALLSLLGGMFSLRHVIIYNYDADFGAESVTSQWGLPGVARVSESIGKVSYEEMALFESRLDENGTVLYTGDDQSLIFCCVMYVNGLTVGRAVYKAASPEVVWREQETQSLFEITKIIAAHLNIEKSNSASRAKSEFLSRVSHEIRTPIAAIIGMTNIARRSLRDGKSPDDSLSKIDTSAKHLLNLINDVLEMSRIESGKLKIEPSPFRLSSFIESVETLLKPPAVEKGVTLAIETACPHDRLIGDEFRLRQVLVNLIGNATKFTSPGGRIQLTITESAGEGAGMFTFSVKDDGIGIGAEDIPGIFRAFEQVSSTAAARQGTGLGLSISMNIVAAMGGKIELTSALGQGSDFYFTIRLAYDDRATDDAGSGEGFDYTGFFTGKRALLVEDNEINVEIAKFILNDAGIETEVALNGLEALDKFTQNPPGYYDVILMDIQMPVMDGLTATRRIRRNSSRHDARAIPIIAMTANAFDEDMKKSVESGMDGHMAKPIDAQRLYETLKEIFNGREPL